MKKNLKTHLLAATLALGVTTAHAQVVHIQPKAILPANQDVHLADLATISNTDPQTAEILANTIILSSLSTNRTIKAEAILMAVIAQQTPALANHLQVSGSSECEITIGQNSASGGQSASQTPFNDTRAMAMTPTRIESETPTPIAISSPHTAVLSPQSSALPPSRPVLTASILPAAGDPDTLAKLITAKIAEDLQTPETDLRITFDSINPDLDEPLAGKVWRFRALSHPLLGNIQFEANLVDGNHAIKRLLIAAHIEKHVQLLVAAADISRGDLLTKNQFALQDSYIDRIVPSVFAKDADVIGLEAQREVAVGSILDKRDFKQAQLVARNDEVTIICLSGSLQVQVTGRSSDSGKLHDVISVKNEKTGEIYQATIIGKRLAVVGGTPDEAQEKLLRETHS